MRRALWLAFITLPFLIAGCAGAPASTPTTDLRPTPTEAPPPVTVTVPTMMEVLPTPTPVAPPPTPTPIPVPSDTPMPEATAERTAEATPEPTGGIAEMPMTFVSAGEFTMGNNTGDDDEKPAHTVFLDAFEVDQFEVTNEQFQAFVEETGYLSEAEQAGESFNWRTFAGDRPRHPVVLVTWNDAVAYCEWQGKRLPTEAEWEKAARGTGGFIYPWGNEWMVGKANTEESGYRGTTIVGSFPDGASPYGVMDMAGNVSEWTSDWYEAYPGSTFQSAYFGEKYRAIRGGGWFSDAHLVRCTERSASSVDLRNDDVGFRCVR